MVNGAASGSYMIRRRPAEIASIMTAKYENHFEIVCAQFLTLSDLIEPLRQRTVGRTRYQYPSAQRAPLIVRSVVSVCVRFVDANAVAAIVSNSVWLLYISRSDVRQTPLHHTIVNCNYRLPGPCAPIYSCIRVNRLKGALLWQVFWIALKTKWIH